jgi:TRAP-type C4-dicarboxylate transport system substrate-binding protein
VKKVLLLGIGCAVLIVIVGSFLFYRYEQEGMRFSVGEEREEAVYRLQFGHDMPVESAQHVTALKFAEIVNHKSAGRVEVGGKIKRDV